VVFSEELCILTSPMSRNSVIVVLRETLQKEEYNEDRLLSQLTRKDRELIL